MPINQPQYDQPQTYIQRTEVTVLPYRLPTGYEKKIVKTIEDSNNTPFDYMSDTTLLAVAKRIGLSDAFKRLVRHVKYKRNIFGKETEG